MSLDVHLRKTMPCDVYSANVTHNLAPMAKEAGIYYHLWRPDEIGVTKASELIEPLREGLERLRSDPDKYRSMNPENGWGSYDNFLPWIERYIEACVENPEAEVEVCR